MWESFKEGWNAFTNNNLVLTLVGILGSLSAVLVILSKTSIGKKTLKWLNEQFDHISKLSKETKEEVGLIKEEVKTAKDDFEALGTQLKEECESKIAGIYLQYTDFKNGVFKVLEQIPNAKVQSQIEQLKENADRKEEEIKTLLGSKYSELSEKAKSTYDNAISKLESENATLKGELEEIKELLAQLPKVAQTVKEMVQTGETDNGREETNTDTREETI